MTAMCEVHGDFNAEECPTCEHNRIYQICEDHGEYTGKRCHRCRCESMMEDEHMERHYAMKYGREQ